MVSYIIWCDKLFRNITFLLCKEIYFPIVQCSVLVMLVGETGTPGSRSTSWQGKGGFNLNHSKWKLLHFSHMKYKKNIDPLRTVVTKWEMAWSNPFFTAGVMSRPARTDIFYSLPFPTGQAGLFKCQCLIANFCLHTKPHFHQLKWGQVVLKQMFQSREVINHLPDLICSQRELIGSICLCVYHLAISLIVSA